MTYLTAAVRTVTATLLATVPTMGRAALCALLGLCLLAGLTSRAGADASPLVVTRTADDNLPGSLRYAIAQAAGTGGTVTFAIPNTDPGYSSAANTDTITLALGQLNITGSLNITAPAAPAAAVVVGGPFNGSAAHVFNVTGGTVAFSNLTITNQDGNGIQNAATLTLTGCTVSNNRDFTGGAGGGISNSGAGASLTLMNCSITGNTEYGKGGGIYNSGTLLATGCSFVGNYSNDDAAAGLGGGGVGNTGTATLNACTFTNNNQSSSLSRNGGGGASNRGGNLTLNNCLLTGNQAAAFGGGAANFSGTLTLNACILEANRAQGSLNGTGGGISNAGTAQITNCVVVSNIAYVAGGVDNSGTLTLINSTFAANLGSTGSGSSTGAGGLLSGPATVVNDIFYGDLDYMNNAYTPSEIVTAPGTAGPTVTFSDVQGGYAGAGNLTADPQFFRNPKTSAYPPDYGDEHLQVTSPAVHTGTNGPGVPTTDIEGTPRPTPPAPPSMGAYEVIIPANGFGASGGFAVTSIQGQNTGAQVVAKFLPGSAPVAGFTAAIDFGDGTGPAAGTIAPDPAVPGVFDVTGSHTYAGFGTFPVTAVISGPGGSPAATVTSTATVQPIDVTSIVTVFRLGLVYNRATQRYVQTVTIQNRGLNPLNGPFSLVLDDLTPGAVLLNPAGTTQFMPPAGSPYQDATATSLANYATLTLVLQFTYSGTARFGYTPRVLTGPAAR